MPPPGGEGKRGRDTKVSLPLLTPQPFLWTRLPSVARLKTRGPQGRLLLQGHTLERSGAFRSGTLPLCTVWPRTVMRGGLRKVNSGHNSHIYAEKRPEPSPRNPRLAANALLSGQRKVKGVSRGDIGNRRCPTSPFAPAAGRRHSHALRGRKVASSGAPLYRRKGPPSADGKAVKGRCPRKRCRSVPPRERSGRARPRRPSPRAHCAAKARALRLFRE